MNLGFETIGNATLIAHDDGPVLVTDPWLQGSAYFGSWKLSHEVPPAQLEAARQARYVWFSHGHPDHLNADSLPLVVGEGKTILLPDHFGGRIHRDLLAQGLDARIMPDGKWLRLSPRIRVLSLTDYNQDAILLVELGDRLVVNLNDASNRGWGRRVRQEIRRHPVAFLLALHGYGDADMLNYFDEHGERVPPPPRPPLGQRISTQADFFGARYFVPFSSMHRYQRTDSVWAAPIAATLDDYHAGFDSKTCELLPPFIRFDVIADTFERIDPPETPDVLHPPEEFGDSWSDPLERGDVVAATEYLTRIEKLHDAIGFVNLRVGGRDHYVRFDPKKQRGFTIEAPRNSLMKVIEHHIFDDLLIGNFARVTLHGGGWGPRRLYPDFTPYVAKYADNGGARTRREIAAYRAAYRWRDPVGYAQHMVEVWALFPLQQTASRLIRGSLGPTSPFFHAARKTYWLARRGL
jgi:L-ascorbate metabolism protein UlaG (beta-lactamase superfamily)